jgi:hypothetical protein
MSVRDDTSRHEGVHSEPGRRYLKRIIISVLVIGAIALLIWGRRQAYGWWALKELRVTSDEGYVYMLLQTEGSGTPDWKTLQYRIAIDTHDPKRGERDLPAPYSASIASGAEFLIDIGGPGDTQIKVTPSYDPYPDHGQAVEGKAIVSPEKSSGSFQEMAFQANRERFWRDGTRIRPVIVERGTLRFVRDNANTRTDLRYDVAVGEDGVIELRIPWGLLNVADPSSRQVLNGISRSENSETSPTDGMRFYVYSFNKGAKKKLLDQMPSRWRTAPLYTWKTWDTPTYTLELKQSSRDIARMMKELSDVPKP